MEGVRTAVTGMNLSRLEETAVQALEDSEIKLRLSENVKTDGGHLIVRPKHHFRRVTQCQHRGKYL